MMILARTELATIDALRASGEEPERILELIESIVNKGIDTGRFDMCQTRRGTARHQQVSRLRARDENS